MKAWRGVLIALSFLLLSGCLVTFKEPLTTSDPAPKGLLGKWSSTNAWGEPMNLELTRLGNDRYQAVTYFKAKPREREAYPFTVSRHGSRWYLSAKVPAQYGGHFTIAGFELTDKHELVVYNLDLEQINQAIKQKALDGQAFQTDDGDGVHVDSNLDKVFAYLDDPANSDVFVEAVRYQRQARAQ
ncbi:lipoprotein [Pseudomonas chlororaphis]|uniref:Lipoprotein n=1 Tax=Pseudomonas chlororaphis TaxID=587753 RepID=A0A0A6DGN5_9PSED|nr:lipoprotein [Pseudomonas chlororaphis]